MASLTTDIITAVCAVLGILSGVGYGIWYLGRKLANLQRKTDHNGQRIEDLTAEIQHNQKIICQNQEAIHKHLMQVDDTENHVFLDNGEVCMFCDFEEAQES